MAFVLSSTCLALCDVFLFPETEGTSDISARRDDRLLCSSKWKTAEYIVWERKTCHIIPDSYPLLSPLLASSGQLGRSSRLHDPTICGSSVWVLNPTLHPGSRLRIGPRLPTERLQARSHTLLKV
ncbi:hypothetical protein V8F20_000438 [Naviculisporaceae sp. PSN 640]